MQNYEFSLGDAMFTAHASGVLSEGTDKLLIVSDLHLGKSSRLARRDGILVPPYETADTLLRLGEAIKQIDPKTVICLGDSFDDLQAMDELSEQDLQSIATLMAGREWIWIEGNHDAGPVHIGGTHLAEILVNGITYRHISQPGARGEVTGHYHPKAHLAGRSNPCFLLDGRKVIMPAYGTYTGGMRLSSPLFKEILSAEALAVLTGAKTRVIPAFTVA